MPLLSKMDQKCEAIVMVLSFNSGLLRASWRRIAIGVFAPRQAQVDLKIAKNSRPE
jgi:hypothetical protein